MQGRLGKVGVAMQCNEGDGIRLGNGRQCSLLKEREGTLGNADKETQGTLCKATLVSQGRLGKGG
jgi:hypothetical protein